MSNPTGEGAPLTHLEARVLAAIERHVRSEGVAPTIAELAANLRLKSKGTVHRYVQSLIAKGRLERHGNGWRGLRIVGLDVPGNRSNVHQLPLRRRSDFITAPLSSALPDSGKRLAGRQADRESADTSRFPRLVDPRRQTAGPVDEPPVDESVDTNVGKPFALPDEDSPAVTSGDFRIPLLGRIAAGLPIEAIEDQHYLDLAAFFIGPDRYALRVTGDSMVDVGILDGDTVILRKQETARTGDIVVALIDGQEATLKRLGAVRDGMVELVPENASMSTMLYAAKRVSFQGVLVGQLRNY